VIESIVNASSGYLLFKEAEFICVPVAKDREKNRETLIRFYSYLIHEMRMQKKDEGSLRSLFHQCCKINKKPTLSLPQIIREDTFLTLYALGMALHVQEAQALLIEVQKRAVEEGKKQQPIIARYNPEGKKYYNVNATPPGIMAKLSSVFRIKADKEMLNRVREDLSLAAKIEDNEQRIALTFALLSFSAAYRGLDQVVLELPHVSKPGYLVPYQCKQHLIAEGVKTISMSAGKDHPAIYLCQGTEIWPSQPYMFGSILANFAEHGSASQAYAHSWRRIHKQLRDLAAQSGSLPIVLGHSMGGSLALQIALYSHDLIDSAHAYNPPAAGERDALFYRTLSIPIKKKFNVYVNIDDPAFWRIGAKVIGNVQLFLGQQRWRYYPIKKLDALFLFPAVIKLFINVIHVFPAHQKIIPLCNSYVTLQLSEEEIAIENGERPYRFDYLRFFPKLYHPFRTCMLLLRKIFKSPLEEEYLCNEIEIVALHERDLMDTYTEYNKEEVDKKLRALSEQKQVLQEKLFLLRKI
jgi:pimeloyl-ACP methyl ester carboxylesterase